MAEPSDHLLRTFGAIPVESRLLDLGCGHGLHTDPLIRLGFDVYGCDTSPEAIEDLRTNTAEALGQKEAEKRISISRIDALGYPDEYFDWVVAHGVLSRMDTREEMLSVLREARRVIRSGGWMYIAVPAIPDDEPPVDGRGYAGDSGLEPTFTPRTVDELMSEASFHVAERPSLAAEGNQRVVHGIYRRAEPDTPV